MKALAIKLASLFILLNGTTLMAEEYPPSQYALNEPFIVIPQNQVVIESGLKITFISHEHKRTKVGGPKSPLIVHMKYEYKDQKFSETHNVHQNSEGELKWIWRTYEFRIISYSYGEDMKISISKTLAK